MSSPATSFRLFYPDSNTINALALFDASGATLTPQSVADGSGNTVSAIVSVAVSRAPMTNCNLVDVNGEAQVDIIDIGLVTGRWGLTAADPGWDPIYDVIVNGAIDVVDVAAVAGCWGYSGQ